ncbi:MAG: hypothetical protein ACK559_05910, partial [bacterium]
MGDVAVGHEEVVVADGGEAPARDGAAGGRRELAEVVPLADAKDRVAAAVLQILRVPAEARVRADARARADLHRPRENGVRPHHHPG